MAVGGQLCVALLLGSYVKIGKTELTVHSIREADIHFAVKSYYICVILFTPYYGVPLHDIMSRHEAYYTVHSLSFCSQLGT
jgi:hypothetical protein